MKNITKLKKPEFQFHGFPEKFKPLLKRAAEFALGKEYIDGCVNFILISDSEIKKLNKKFRKVNRITDVISFSYKSGSRFHGKAGREAAGGDVYISEDRSKKQAKRVKHNWEKELAYLVIHGILHLLGHSDYTPWPKKKMFKAQDKVFKCLFL